MKIRSWLLQPILHYLKEIIMKQDQAVEILGNLGTQLTKVSGEITKALEDARANAGDLTPELEAALTRIQASVQTLDDLNPDTPTGDTGTDPGTDEPTA